MDTKTLEKFVEELAEKIYSCEGTTGIKLLAKKLNELSEKYKQDVVAKEMAKFNKAVHDAYHAFYAATGKDYLPLCFENTCEGISIINVTDVEFNDVDGSLILYYDD